MAWVRGCFSKMEFEELKVEIPVDDGEKDEKEFPFMLERRYENKSGCFVTGFDVTSKEAEMKRKRRAKRFGLQLANTVKEDSNDIQSEKDTDTRLSPLPAEEDLPAVSNGEVRPEALLVHGVDDMSTKDVFSYFGDFAPGCIEWIDDSSCNVVWDDDFTASRVLMVFGKDIHTNEQEDKTSERIKWKIGPPHPKAKQLLLRLATKKDKKQPGAAKRSMYYLVNGHPEHDNYKGAKKGLISSSRKRKIMQERERAKHLYSDEPEVKFLDNIEPEKEEKMEIDEPPLKIVVTNNGPIEKKDTLSLRMRMHADSEGNDSESDDDDDSREKRDSWKSRKERTDSKPEEKKAPSLDLRSKLQGRYRHRFDFKNRPSLSIEIKEEEEEPSS